jgi:hypothetical protein
MSEVVIYEYLKLSNQKIQGGVVRQARMRTGSATVARLEGAT